MVHNINSGTSYVNLQHLQITVSIFYTVKKVPVTPAKIDLFGNQNNGQRYKNAVQCIMHKPYFFCLVKKN